MKLRRNLGKIKNLGIAGFISMTVSACQTTEPYTKTAEQVDINKFMGKWYVIASRPTFLEEGAHNATETYTLKDGEIDVLFEFRDGAFDGELDTIPQTAEVYNRETNAHWMISTWWMPFPLDYLILAVAPDYEWTAVGVPSQKYLWVMARSPSMAEDKLSKILSDLKSDGYDTSDVDRVPHQPLH